MKIIPFTPNLLNKPNKVAASRAGEGGFAANLAVPPPGGGESGGSLLVSLENRRALNPPDDLGRAVQLLSRLERAIKRESPESLARAHDLEGLICIYRGAGD